jgi:BRCA1/BRCA2-containing complex subunit 3
MPLIRVDITPSVYQACVNYALLNEKEEILGLLLGTVEDEATAAAAASTSAGATPSAFDEDITGYANKVARVWCALPLIRIDRRRDRTETSPEQMTQAAQFAEKFWRDTGLPTR